LEPTDAFRLTPQEKAECIARVKRLNKLRLSVALPYAYTEAGALHLAGLLANPKAQNQVEAVEQAFGKAREQLGLPLDTGIDEFRMIGDANHGPLMLPQSLLRIDHQDK